MAEWRSQATRAGEVLPERRYEGQGRVTLGNAAVICQRVEDDNIGGIPEDTVYVT